MTSDVTFVVLAAGIGSRYDGSKQLATFGEKKLTIAEYNMLHAIACGVRNFVIVISEPVADDIYSRMRNFLPKNCTFSMVYQNREHELCKFCNRTKPWGTAHAVLCCKMAINSNFCVTNADDLYGKSAIGAIIHHMSGRDRSSTNFANVAYSIEDTISCGGTVSRGVMTVDGEHHMVSIDEVYEIDENRLRFGGLRDALVSMNLWGFTPKIFDMLCAEWSVFKKNISNAATDEFGLPDAINSCIRSNMCTVDVIRSNCKWAGVTYRSDDGALERALANECQTAEVVTEPVLP